MDHTNDDFYAALGINGDFLEYHSYQVVLYAKSSVENAISSRSSVIEAFLIGSEIFWENNSDIDAATNSEEKRIIMLAAFPMASSLFSKFNQKKESVPVFMQTIQELSDESKERFISR